MDNSLIAEISRKFLKKIYEKMLLSLLTPSIKFALNKYFFIIIDTGKSPAGKIPAGKSPGGENSGGEKSGGENSFANNFYPGKRHIIQAIATRVVRMLSNL